MEDGAGTWGQIYFFLSPFPTHVSSLLSRSVLQGLFCPPVKEFRKEKRKFLTHAGWTSCSLSSLCVLYSRLLQKSKEKREKKTESFYRGGLLGRGLTSSRDEPTQQSDGDEDIGICRCGVYGKNFSLSCWEASNTISVASDITLNHMLQ